MSLNFISWTIVNTRLLHQVLLLFRPLRTDSSQCLQSLFVQRMTDTFHQPTLASQGKFDDFNVSFLVKFFSLMFTYIFHTSTIWTFNVSCFCYTLASLRMRLLYCVAFEQINVITLKIRCSAVNACLNGT